MIRSFRLRLVWWSALVSGGVLLLFGSMVLAHLQARAVRELDRELEAFGIRLAAKTGAAADWTGKTGADLDWGGEAPGPALCLLRRPDGGELWRSADWPAQLRPTDHPAPDAWLDPQPVLEPKIRGRQRRVMAPRVQTVRAGKRRLRVGAFANEEVTLWAAVDLAAYTGVVQDVGRSFLIALPLALLLIGLGAWWLGSMALHPIRVLGRDMRRVSADALDQRLALASTDHEFGEILSAYNDMLARLETSFHQASRFSADASHELKTPLAVMQASLEQALARGAGGEEAAPVYAELQECLARQQGILEGLLLLSQADAGRLQVSADPVDLTAAFSRWLEDLALLAGERALQLSGEVAPGIVVVGDIHLLARLVHNLMSNAVRYTPEGGEIRWRLAAEDGGALLAIGNSGPALSEADQARIWERFTRGEGGGEDGLGIGLNLVREIAAVHQGRVEIRRAEGLTWFEFRLPLAEAPG